MLLQLGYSADVKATHVVCRKEHLKVLCDINCDVNFNHSGSELRDILFESVA